MWITAVDPDDTDTGEWVSTMDPRLVGRKNPMFRPGFSSNASTSVGFGTDPTFPDFSEEAKALRRSCHREASAMEGATAPQTTDRASRTEVNCMK